MQISSGDTHISSSNNIPLNHQKNSCYGNSLKLFASLSKFVVLLVSGRGYHLLRFYRTRVCHFYQTSMSWNMYQNAEKVASNGWNYPEVKGKNKQVSNIIEIKKIYQTKWRRSRASYHLTVLPAETGKRDSYIL